MINWFFFSNRFLFLCSIVLYMPILLTLSGRHPHYPSFIHHFKRKTWVDGPYSGVCRPKREQRKMKGLILFWLDEKQKYRREMEKLDEKRNALLHPHWSHSLFFIFSFFLSLSAPWGLGVSCNLSIGFSLCLSCHLFSIISLSLSPKPFLFHFHVSLPMLFRFLSLSFALAPLSAGFPELIISVFAACLWQGSLAGRKAGWWPLRSWVTQVRCKRCPWGVCVSYLCGMPENTHPLA